MCWRCSVVRCQTDLLAVASTASPTALAKSLAKRASSRHPENGQRLAGNADNTRRNYLEPAVMSVMAIYQRLPPIRGAQLLQERGAGRKARLGERFLSSISMRTRRPAKYKPLLSLQRTNSKKMFP